MTKSKIFLGASLSYITGVLLASFLNFPCLILWEMLVVALIFLLIVYLFQKKWFLFSLFVLMAGMGGIMQTQTKLDQIKKQPIILKGFSSKGIIIKEPEKKDRYQKVIILVNGEKEQKRILIKTDPYLSLHYGDEVSFNCQPQRPQNFSPDFNYEMFLAKEKIYYTCSDNNLKVLAHHQANFIYAYILEIKHKLEKTINQLLPQPEAGLANGLLLGGSQRLTQDWREKFSQTGMSHIVAVSGFNITIIASYLIILGILFGLRRQEAFWLALGGIIFFIILIAWPASAVRAGVMGGLLLWAIKKGRLATSFNAILLAGVVMLVFNPLLLRWDIGFQLSFLATLGLVLLSPFWEKYFLKQQRLGGLAEIFFLTLSAQIFVLPIIFVNFHNFSPISFLANLLILGILPLTMGLVFLTAITGILFHPLGLVLAWLSYLFLHYILEVIKILAEHSEPIKINNFKGIFFLLWYGVIFLVYYLGMKKRTINDRLN